MAINLRQIEIFRPYNKEVSKPLLIDAGLDEATVDSWLASDLVRVAKLGEEVLAVYAMDKGDGETYQLHGAVVASNHRKQGLGRWLVGHAIGVAESKGARHVLFTSKQAPRFLGAIGFVPADEGQRFDLIPE